jgi:hypothetical protein
LCAHNGGKRADQLIDPESANLGSTGPRAGRPSGPGELELRNPDRILVAHTRRHQPRDLGEHGIVDPVAADEPLEPVDVKLRVARTLIVDQAMNGLACHRRHGLRQSRGQKRRRVVVLADEIGKQIAQGRQDTAV